MPPLAGNGIGADDGFAFEHQPAADTGAQNHAEYALRTGRGAVNRLGKRKTVCVIGDSHRTA